jgi:hypothetical protein
MVEALEMAEARPEQKGTPTLEKRHKQEIMNDEFDMDSVELIKAVISEHYGNYAFVVLDDDGTLFYDYTNAIIGEALFSKSLLDMQADMEAEMLSEAFDRLDYDDED